MSNFGDFEFLDTITCSKEAFDNLIFDFGTDACSISNTSSTGVWKTKPVEEWTSKDIVQWLHTVLEKYLLDQVLFDEFLNISVFPHLNGRSLLSLSELDFICLDPKFGVVLYQALQEHLSFFSKNGCQTKGCSISYDDLSTYLCTGQNFFDENIINIAPLESDRLQESSFSACGSQSHIVLDAVATRNKKSGSWTSIEKKQLGRPKVLHRDSKRKQEKRTGRLWEFIRNLLLNKEYCPSLICWENYDEGIFRFVQSEKVAQLWGNLKSNPKMTYEKLSRAMRYYYKSNVLQPVLGRRLVYKFGPCAYGWRTTNPNFLF